MNFGQKLRRLREEKGISQQELAKRLGYKSNSYIYDIEKGSFIPTDEKIKRLARALMIPSSRIKDILFESRLESLGIKDANFINMLKNYSRLTKSDKEAIVRVYLEKWKGRIKVFCK
ncbi:helix-turn-helix domain-containing protein [Candidatus Methanoperedens nitratireducens]|uniref:Putative Helix-turn-helix domain protein n=1 Tax=Candidatus Methanoperedens nitratireducens TaxID=1392998 RepID=A0A284VPJ0_9EURY|nr:helix-turn-helix transcriptional regulator [Candidatus Methanoperedens nitroreducens]SNQ61194.1 putative Helix-turn-helix domain protein [Candidatus Methanoperedens nitroreducens]